VTGAGAMATHAARLARQAAEVAVCLDFDGTIAPIVEDPAAARPLAGIVELLGPLADRYAAAALVSGRPATYLASHAAAPGVRYLGMYGLEEIVEGRVQVDRRLEAARPAVAAARRDLAADPAVLGSGAHLEDKRYAVAVHTRRVADPARWAGPVGQAAERVAAAHGLEVVPGRMVWELRPQVRSDKADAVRRVAAESGARRLVVAGDDLGDLPAFAVAAEAGGGLRVAVRSEEAPAELLDAADLVVDGPEGVRELLEHLLR
jgi:trehalose 6-phosphate phosphatase